MSAINNNKNSQEKKISEIPDTQTELSGEQIPEIPYIRQASFYNPEKEIDKLYKWMYGIVVAMAIAFFFILYDFIKEKEIIINYGNLSDKYFERYLDLNNSFNNIKNQNNLIELKIQEMETRSEALNNIIEDDTIRKSEKIELENKINQQQDMLDCLKNKRYWQYEQCFK